MEKLAPRLEDYLETIYLLEKKNGVARVKEIAKERNVKMPTVTEVLKRLSEKGYINYEKYGFATTTEKGKEYAEKIYKKHRALKKFFTEILNLPQEVAEKEGCLIEHYLSKSTVERFVKLVEFFEENNLKEKLKRWMND
jgi:DtxR family Mn-dependent transcriptional regulator